MRQTSMRRMAGAWALRATVVVGAVVAAAAGRDLGAPEVRANAVLRWEYRPGSALLVRWSHGHVGGGAESTCARRRTFRLPGVSALTLKATWSVER